VQKTSVLLDDAQIKRLKRVKPCNLSKFINDRVQLAINEMHNAKKTQKIIEQAVNKGIGVYQERVIIEDAR
jgi:hypothetical protein